jgi:hypothetical protein
MICETSATADRGATLSRETSISTGSPVRARWSNASEMPPAAAAQFDRSCDMALRRCKKDN